MFSFLEEALFVISFGIEFIGISELLGIGIVLVELFSLWVVGDLE